MFPLVGKHIPTEMRKQLILKVVNQKSKTFTFYEPSIVSYKSILKFYFKTRNFKFCSSCGVRIMFEIITTLYCQCLRKTVNKT